jgi:2-dehydropantoate 2-reductase
VRVGVFGAGAIGSFLGIRLSAAGVPVTLVGRSSLVQARDVLVALGVDGSEVKPADDLVAVSDHAALSEVDVCLVSVKSRDTMNAARSLAEVLAPEAVVVSVQNGLRNPARLREVLKQCVVPGMVSYNVLREGAGGFRQATSGPIVTGPGEGPAAATMKELAAAFVRAGDKFELRKRVGDVMCGKLLLNLINGVCAVTGLTIAEAMRSRTVRWSFAQLMREGLKVMHAAGLRPSTVLGIPPGAIARLLALPDAFVLRVAKKLVSIDPRAKSSTLQDLEAGKATEIDDLSGEIVRLAAKAGKPAPKNRVIVDVVHSLEIAAPPLPFLTPDELRERLTAARA